MSTGGDGILTITGFGRFEKLHAEYNRLLQRVAKLEAELKKAKAAAKETEDAQATSAEVIGNKIESIAARWFTATQALSLYNLELDKQKQLANDALQKSQSLAAAQIELMGNIGPRATRAERLGIVDRMGRAGAGMGLSAEDAQRAASRISAAVPDGSPLDREKKILDLMGLATRFYPSDTLSVEGIGELGAAGGGLMASTKGLTADQSIRALAAILAMSRLSDASKLPSVQQALVTSQNMSPNADPGKNLMQTAAMIAAMTQRINDPDGELSRTAMANFASVFRTNAPQYGDMPLWDAVKKAREENPNLMRKIIPKLLGRAFTKSPQAEFLKEKNVIGAMTDMIEGEMNVSDDQWSTFLEDMSGGTPDIKRNRILGAHQAKTSEYKLQPRAQAGGVAAMLFGGQSPIDGKNYPGVYPSTGHFGTSWASQMFAENAYWSYIESGVDPKRAAQLVMQYSTDMSRSYNPMATIMGGRRTEADIQLMQETLDNIRKLPDVIEDNTAQITNGQNAQAAAAQRGAQTE